MRVMDELVLRPKDFADKIAFVFFAIGGVACLFAAKSLGFPQPVVTGGLVAAMLVYFVAATALGKLKLQPDQVGDNCYYLGFIYTLGSLGYTLYVFAGDSAGVRSIISNFGIAVLTTMLGIMLRVILHQMRVDPGDIEQEARIALAEAALRLRAELDEVVLDMSSFRVATQQSIAEGFDEIAARSGAVLTDAVKSFEAVTSKAADSMSRTFETFTKDAARLGNSSAAVVDALETLVARVGQIEAPADLVATKIAPAIGKIGDLVALIERRAACDDDRIRAVEALVQGAASATQDIAAAASAIKDRAEGVKASFDELSSLRGESDRLAAALAAAAEAAQSLAGYERRRLDDETAVTDARLKAVREAAKRGAQELSRMMAEEVRNAAVEMRQLAGTYRGEALQSGAATVEGLRAAAASVGETVREVANDVKAIAATSIAGVKESAEAMVEGLKESASAASRYRAEVDVDAKRAREVQGMLAEQIERLAARADRLPETSSTDAAEEVVGSSSLPPAPVNGRKPWHLWPSRPQA